MLYPEQTVLPRKQRAHFSQQIVGAPRISCWSPAPSLYLSVTTFSLFQFALRHHAKREASINSPFDILKKKPEGSFRWFEAVNEGAARNDR